MPKEHLYHERKWDDGKVNVDLKGVEFELIDDILEEYGVVSLVDVGCGTGKILRFLTENGIYAAAIDTCDNCLEVPGRKPIQCDILDLKTFEVDPEHHRHFYEGEFEVALCSDVMEHLPEEIIDDALENLRWISAYGAVIGISLLPDSGKLHCSVHDAGWWETKLKEHFPVVERREVPQLHPRQGPDSWGLWLCRKVAA